MSCSLILLVLFSCFVQIVYCQPYVSLQAPTTVVYKQDKIHFTCSPTNVAGTDTISDIILQKNSTIYNWQDVVKVFTDTSTGQLLQKITWTDTNMQNRATVITQVTAPTSSAGLKIEISADRVACTDEGNYRCTTSGNKGLGGKLDSMSTHAHVGLVVQANSIDSIRVHPQMPDNTYNPGTMVTLTCTGDVGNPAGDLRWCIKRESTDISFTYYPNSADISQGSAMLSGCQYSRSSTLTYNVSSNIPEVDFRCETGPFATCGLFSTLAANFTLIIFTQSSDTRSQNNNPSSPGSVVGGVLGGIFAIIAFVLIIIVMRKQGLLVYRRTEILERRQKHTALSTSVCNKNSYENEIARTPEDLGQTVVERSYESLGVKGIPNMYEQLTEENEIKPTYQTLGEIDKPNVYDDLSNQSGLDNDEYVNVTI